MGKVCVRTFRSGPRDKYTLEDDRQNHLQQFSYCYKRTLNSKSVGTSCCIGGASLPRSRAWTKRSPSAPVPLLHVATTIASSKSFGDQPDHQITTNMYSWSYMKLDHANISISQFDYELSCTDASLGFLQCLLNKVQALADDCR